MRDQTQVSCVSALASGFFTTEPPGKPLNHWTTMEFMILSINYLLVKRVANKSSKFGACLLLFSWHFFLFLVNKNVKFSIVVKFIDRL